MESSDGLCRRPDHSLPLVGALYMDACRLAVGLAVRQSKVRADMVAVKLEAGQDRRVILIEPAYDLLAVPYRVPIEELHLAVVRVAYHVDVAPVCRFRLYPTLFPNFDKRI